MCRAVVPRVGAGEREVTLTVNGKTPLVPGQGWEGAERVLALPQGARVGSGPHIHLRLWVHSDYIHLLQSVSEPSPGVTKDLSGCLVTSLLSVPSKGSQP